jgi:hypothetical protein
MKTDSLALQDSTAKLICWRPTQHISTADAGIINAHNLLLTQESLMKTEFLPTQKSSTQPIYG